MEISLSNLHMPIVCRVGASSHFLTHHNSVKISPTSAFPFPIFIPNPDPNFPNPRLHSMDPCPFLRIRVGNLALKLPNPPISSSSSFYYAKIKLSDFPIQIATVPLTSPEPAPASAACFTLTKQDLDSILLLAKKKKKKPALSLNIDVYGDCNKEKTNCGFGFGFGSGNLVGRVSLPLELGPDGSASGLMHNGWARVGGGKTGAELYVSVKSDPDPRFVFEFDSQPECSPQVFQVQGSIKQPVFTCKFGFRNSGERNLRCRSLRSETSTSAAACWWSGGKQRRVESGERKGWTVTVHDLSGSPVAVASMVTPFVASVGSDRVSRSNPGAWLILRPGEGTWKPWGRLEAWRDHGHTVSHRFEILSASSDSGFTLSSGPLNPKFSIDTAASYYSSPLSSPNSSFDLSSWSGSGGSGSDAAGPHWLYKGFVMSGTVGEDNPTLQVGAQHVTCTEDAAVFVALAAAAHLTLHACRPFSHKLTKELRPPNRDLLL